LKALEIDPSNKKARTWLSHLGEKLKSLSVTPSSSGDKTTRSPKKILNREKAYSLYKEGLIAYSGEQFATAISLWEEALALDPQLGRAQQALRQARTELIFRQRK
jgi:tetratricopeptide (TPR) repeat protein